MQCGTKLADLQVNLVLAMREIIQVQRLRFGICLCLVLASLATGACARKRPARRPLPPPIARPAPPAADEAATSTEPRAVGSPQQQSMLTAPDGCQPSAQPPWLQCQFRNARGDALSYFLFLPRTASRNSVLPQTPGPGNTQFPVVTFLHGSSGSGPGDGKPLVGGHRYGSGLWIRNDVQARYPSIVVAPQAAPRPGETWVRAWRAPPPGDNQPTELLVLVNELLDTLATQLPVAKDRLYLTGQSMGGFGSWLAYTRFPGRFAAVVPVCGGGDPSAVVPNDTAVWSFHGDRDTVVPVSRSREMIDAIRSTGGNVRYTEYPGLGHNIFERAYSEAELVDWLFSQQLPQNGTRE